MGEIRKENLHESLVNELNELANIDLSGYQEKTDGNLDTNAKDLVGAINELVVKYETLNIKYEEVKNTVNNELQIIECVSLSLNKTTLSIDGIGESEEIIATILPSNCNETLLWLSSNPNIATVNNGVITTVSVGTCVIIAICGTKSVSCQLEVTNNESMLISGGAVINHPIYGSPITDMGAVDQIVINSELNRVEFISLSDYSVLGMCFDKYVENMSAKQLKVTAFIKEQSDYKPEIMVAIRTEKKSVYTNYNHFTTTSTAAYTGMTGMTHGTVKAEYIIDLSQLQGASGYLVLAMKSTRTQRVDVCVTDVEIIH